jgi:hypothetical protein
MTEAQFTETVIELARFRGWKVAHFRPALDRGRWRTAMSGDKGYPDLTLARRGRVIFAELKSETGRPSKEQLEWIEALTYDGNEVYLWRPHDLESIKEVLR